MWRASRISRNKFRTTILFASSCLFGLFASSSAGFVFGVTGVCASTRAETAAIISRNRSALRVFMQSSEKSANQYISFLLQKGLQAAKLVMARLFERCAPLIIADPAIGARLQEFRKDGCITKVNRGCVHERRKA